MSLGFHVSAQWYDEEKDSWFSLPTIPRSEIKNRKDIEKDIKENSIYTGSYEQLKAEINIKYLDQFTDYERFERLGYEFFELIAGLDSSKTFYLLDYNKCFGHPEHRDIIPKDIKEFWIRSGFKTHDYGHATLEDVLNFYEKCLYLNTLTFEYEYETINELLELSEYLLFLYKQYLEKDLECFSHLRILFFFDS